jgi:carbon-monoxide dehydrogenase medium subunit
VKPARFRYADPTSLEETFELLEEFGDEAVLLAGGQSLVPMMNLRLIQQPVVIDLNRIEGLAHIRRERGHLAIGAMARQRTVERSPEVARWAPLVSEALPHVAHPAIRGRGTVGGSTAHADPASELCCALVAADASVVLASRSGRREVPAHSFFQGPYMTAREATEVVVELRIPALQGATGAAFEEFAPKSGEFALALAAVTLTVDGDSCTHARVAVGGAGPVPVRCTSAEAVLEGAALNATVVAEAAASAAAEVEPAGDHHGSAAFRRRLVEVEVRRALTRALSHTRGSDA